MKKIQASPALTVSETPRRSCKLQSSMTGPALSKGLSRPKAKSCPIPKPIGPSEPSCSPLPIPVVDDSRTPLNDLQFPNFNSEPGDAEGSPGANVVGIDPRDDRRNADRIPRPSFPRRKTKPKRRLTKIPRPASVRGPSAKRAVTTAALAIDAPWLCDRRNRNRISRRARLAARDKDACSEMAN